MVSKTEKLYVHHRKQFFCGYKAVGGRGEDSKLELCAAILRFQAKEVEWRLRLQVRALRPIAAEDSTPELAVSGQ